METTSKRKARKAQQVTLLGMLIDIILGIIKLLAGYAANSQALIADGIHSLSDAATDILVIVITHFSHHVPDANHPYGHARFETMGTLLLGSSLITIALLLAYNYLTLAVSGQNQVTPGWPALLVALVSIAAKEWIFHYTKKAGEKLRSNLLIANAWHSRTDAFSSIIVLIGVAGSMLGVHWFDLVAALIVALIILKIGWQLVWDSSKELVDSSADPEQIEQLRETLFTAEGILNVHDLRTRRMGQDILLDVHLQVSSDISVSEGHQIGAHAAQQLLKQHSFINDVIYHIDAEDDHNVNHRKSMALLPLRNKVLSALKANWPEMPKIQKLTLHYLNQQIDIEIVFNATQLKNGPTPLNSEKIKQQIMQRNKQLPWLGKVVVYIQQNTNP